MPNSSCHGSTLRVAVDTKNALDQTANIGVYNWSVLMEGEAKNGSCSIPADSGKRDELLKRARQFSIKLVDHILGNLMQSCRSEIITQRSPEFFHLF